MKENDVDDIKDEKSSLKIKNKDIPFSIKFGNPLKFYNNQSIESITSQIEKIIN